MQHVNNVNLLSKHASRDNYTLLDRARDPLNRLPVTPWRPHIHTHPTLCPFSPKTSRARSTTVYSTTGAAGSSRSSVSTPIIPLADQWFGRLCQELPLSPACNLCYVNIKGSTAKKYHLRSSCSGGNMELREDKASLISAGWSGCGTCAKPGARMLLASSVLSGGEQWVTIPGAPPARAAGGSSTAGASSRTSGSAQVASGSARVASVGGVAAAAATKVYITPKGKKMHKNRGCRQLKNCERVDEVTQSEGERRNMEFCKTCSK